MGSVVVGPRIEFATDHYPRIRYWDGDREWYFYLHRLTAYAQGGLDHPCASIEFPALDAGTGKVRTSPDPRDVHHRDADSWNNHHDNIRSQTWEEHKRIEPQTANLKRRSSMNSES